MYWLKHQSTVTHLKVSHNIQLNVLLDNSTFPGSIFELFYQFHFNFHGGYSWFHCPSIFWTCYVSVQSRIWIKSTDLYLHLQIFYEFHQTFQPPATLTNRSSTRREQLQGVRFIVECALYRRYLPAELTSTDYRTHIVTLVQGHRTTSHCTNGRRSLGDFCHWKWTVNRQYSHRPTRSMRTNYGRKIRSDYFRFLTDKIWIWWRIMRRCKYTLNIPYCDSITDIILMEGGRCRASAHFGKRLS